MIAMWGWYCRSWPAGVCGCDGCPCLAHVHGWFIHDARDGDL